MSKLFKEMTYEEREGCLGSVRERLSKARLIKIYVLCGLSTLLTGMALFLLLASYVK